MAKQTVGIGSAANDGTGDTLRDGADKINDNFNEIYSALGNSSSVLTDIIDANGLFDVSSGANKIVFYYAALTDLPSASTYHGAIAHVHATGGMYFAHGGNWIRLMMKLVAQQPHTQQQQPRVLLTPFLVQVLLLVTTLTLPSTKVILT